MAEITCWLCERANDDLPAGRTSTGHSYGFIDTRTGRAFCPTHAEALLSWEQAASVDASVADDPDLGVYREAVTP